MNTSVSGAEVLFRPGNMLTLASAVAILVLTAGSACFAHGLGYRQLASADAVVLEFHYSDGQELSYAEVEVWGPEDTDVEYQNCRTDKHGRFAFLPENDGIWKVRAADGIGHAVESAINRGSATSNGDAGAAVSTITLSELPKPASALLGLSLLFNGAFLILWWKKQFYR